MDSRVGISLCLCAVLALATSSCASYRPLVVRAGDSSFSGRDLVVIKRAPIVADAGFTVYESFEEQGVFYVAPTTLEVIDAQRGTLQAIGLERYDGYHLIFIAQMGPRVDYLSIAATKLSEQGIKVTALKYYPIDRLTVRPLTDPRLPSKIAFTAVPAFESPNSPFTVLLLVQVTGAETILDFKKLLESPAALLLEGSYSISNS